MSNNRMSAYIALLIVLIIGVVINIFPILPRVPISDYETELLQQVLTLKGSNIATVLHQWNGGNVITTMYAYVCNLIFGIEGTSNAIFWLRFPSAAITAILTICLFRFDRTSEKIGNSFVVSLVFLGSLYVSMLSYNANPVMISAALTILSFVSMYHWLRRQTTKNAILMCIATSANIIITGTVPLASMALTGILFILTVRPHRKRGIAVLMPILALSAIAAFAVMYVLSGDFGLAKAPFTKALAITVHLDEVGISGIAPIDYFLLSALPWSVPMLIALPWAIMNWKSTSETLNHMTMVQRFGIIVFITSLPLFFFYSEFSYVMLLACVFFNAPVLGNLLITQFNKHADAWRITGVGCWILFAIATSLFVWLNMGHTQFGLSIPGHQWTYWNIILTVSIAISLYTLTRNWREVHRNHRFFFNLIVLYMLFQNLFFGYILQSLYYQGIAII